VDSDAYFNNDAPPLEALLRKYGASDLSAADIFFGWDHPYTLGPNMGLIVMRNTPLTRDLVDTWWNTDPGQYATVHPFEQHLLQWNLVHVARFQKRLMTLTLRTMDPTAASSGAAVVHLDHNAGTKTRLWTMSGALTGLLCAPSARAASKHCTSELRAAKKLLQQPRQTVRTSGSARAKLFNTVLTAVCADFKSGPAHKTERFNASHFGQTHMHQPPVSALSLQGAPVHLANCSTDPVMANWQSWMMGTGTMLRLPWDSRTNQPKPCTGFCLLTIISLFAQPDLCLSLGNARSLRQPYTILAQLELCTAKSIPKDRRKAGQHRSRLNFNTTSGILRTTHHVGEFRKLLPEHRLGCGFWSNCSGVRTVLPKPCWSKLQADPEACGEDDSSLQAARRRFATEKDPAYKRIVVAPEGPVSAPVLSAPGKDRLCMQPWRGFFREGQPVTFYRCPQRNTLGRAHRWASTEHFEWDALPVRSEGGEDGVGPESEHAVRLVPRAAPHLCLTAGALMEHGVSGLYRPVGVKPRSLVQDYATRIHAMEDRRQRTERRRTRRQDPRARKAELDEKRQRRREKEQHQEHSFAIRRQRAERKRRRAAKQRGRRSEAEDE